MRIIGGASLMMYYIVCHDYAYILSKFNISVVRF